LLNELIEQGRQTWLQMAERTNEARYCFDDGKGEGRMLKSTTRMIVTAAHAKFEAREVVRQNTQTSQIHRSAGLGCIAPKGMKYGYDVIAQVGIQAFIEGKRLQEIQTTFANRVPGIEIPISTLYDLQLRFLFYLGHMHTQAAPRLKAYLEETDSNLWLIDGTLEPNTPVFFGVQEARHGILLHCTKMPAEHAHDIAGCLTEAARLFGAPKAVLRDLSPTVERGVSQAFPEIAQFVCHYHFCRALGEALYKKPQNALLQRLRKLKLQVRLKHQRTDQTAELRRELAATVGRTSLEDLLYTPHQEASMTARLGREILLACHYWLLDYFSDGNRQGFPFDPYTLYLHRRLLKAQHLLENALQRVDVPDVVPLPLQNMFEKLNAYCADHLIQAAGTQYEVAWEIFSEVRRVLRITPESRNPMRATYALKPGEQEAITDALQQLRGRLELQAAQHAIPAHRELYQIALGYLDKHSACLSTTREASIPNGLLQRTTNALEAHWGASKKGARLRHGRSKLTRDFQAHPPELMLLPNLNKPEYVRIVLGRIENLPDKLAEAGANAGSFQDWRQKHRSLKLGKLSTRVLRKPNFLEDVLELMVQSHERTA
jgi:hypothetical protein